VSGKQGKKAIKATEHACQHSKQANTANKAKIQSSQHSKQAKNTIKPTQQTSQKNNQVNSANKPTRESSPYSKQGKNAIKSTQQARQKCNQDYTANDPKMQDYTANKSSRCSAAVMYSSDCVIYPALRSTQGGKQKSRRCIKIWWEMLLDVF